MSSAKVIINLSKSEIVTDLAFSPRPSHFIYQLKGRVVEALFSGAICVSEYAPQHKLLNISNHLSEFKSPNELLDRLEKIDYSPLSIRNKYYEFYETSWSIYCDLSIINRFDQLMDEVSISHFSSKPVSINNIDNRYFSTTNTSIMEYFSRNPHLQDEELSLLNNCT